MKTENDQIVDVQCAEIHIFRPFSAGFEKPSGAITFVKQSMKFVGHKTGKVSVNFEISMLYFLIIISDCYIETLLLIALPHPIPCPFRKLGSVVPYGPIMI